MAHIQRRRDRSGWIARYRAPDGRERSRSFRRKSEAEAFLTTVEADKLRGLYVDPRLGRTTFAEWANRWEASRVHVRTSTAARDHSLLHHHVLPALGDYQLAAITAADLQGWIATLVASGLASDTVRKTWRIARAVLDSAATSRLIGSPPIRGVKLPKHEQAEPRFLTSDQIEELSEVIDPRYRVLVLAAAYTGCRWGELVGLERDDLDLMRRRLTINRTLSEISGHVSIGAPKTAASRRTITLPAFLCEELAVHLAETPGRRVFSAPGGGPLRASNWRSRFWYPATRLAQLGEPEFHSLRHSHVALLIAQGEHPKTIADRLGHNDVRTVLNVYGHLIQGLDETAADRLDEARNEAVTGRRRDEPRGAVLPFG